MDTKITGKFQYPTDITLSKNPLLEAWLEIRWKLAESSVPDFKTDPYYPFALGIFYNSVKDKFGVLQELPASKAPDFAFPHMVQHRFRPAQDGWPLLQLGAGIATVNFTKPYSWQEFKDMALYLQDKLIHAYQDSKLETETIILHYRNGFSFEFSNNNFLDFLANTLNLSVSLPNGIPSYRAQKPFPTGSNMIFSYDLNEPEGTGQIQIGTAVNTDLNNQVDQSQNELIVCELAVSSKGDKAPSISQTDEFTKWLDSAHAIIHEWFFSFIRGELFEKFSKGE